METKNEKINEQNEKNEKEEFDITLGEISHYKSDYETEKNLKFKTWKDEIHRLNSILSHYQEDNIIEIIPKVKTYLDSDKKKGYIIEIKIIYKKVD